MFFYLIANKYHDFLKRKILRICKLNHENILNNITHFFYNNYFYIVTEFAKGQNLEEWLGSKKFIEGKDYISEEFAKNVIKQLQDALKFCHERRISHGNLSLKNVYFKDADVGIGEICSSKIAVF